MGQKWAKEVAEDKRTRTWLSTYMCSSCPDTTYPSNSGAWLLHGTMTPPGPTDTPSWKQRRWSKMRYFWWVFLCFFLVTSCIVQLGPRWWLNLLVRAPAVLMSGTSGYIQPLRNHHLVWIDAGNQDKALSGFERCCSSHKLQVPVLMSQLRD